MTEGRPLLEVRDIRKHYPLRQGLPWAGPAKRVRAVDGVSFSIAPHETMSLVGETGCGKTTTGRLILRLEEPTSGTIHFAGRDLTRLQGTALRKVRPMIQAVFQDPWSSLSPRMRARDIVSEPLVENTRSSKAELREQVAEILIAVGLKATDGDKYPHEFSGGQRQRVAIARALALEPSIVVLDEPVSALDVSVRAQVMNLLKDLQEQSGAAYLLIAHDLATVRYLSHQVAVMYLGQIVEYGEAKDVFEEPLHPYTKALISAAIPTRPGERREEILLGGEVPSPTDPPSGCRFHPRCPLAFDRCSREVPPLETKAAGRSVACHLYT